MHIIDSLNFSHKNSAYMHECQDIFSNTNAKMLFQSPLSLNNLHF